MLRRSKAVIMRMITCPPVTPPPFTMPNRLVPPSPTTSYRQLEPEHLSPNFVWGGQIRTDNLPYNFFITVFQFYMFITLEHRRLTTGDLLGDALPNPIYSATLVRPAALVRPVSFLGPVSFVRSVSFLRPALTRPTSAPGPHPYHVPCEKRLS